MQLEGRAFLVTGGGSGLGAACVEELAKRGARVVACDVRAPSSKQSGDCIFEKTDVTREEDVNRAVRRSHQEFGRLDGAICCAGIAASQRIVDAQGKTAPLKDFVDALTVNVVGTYNVIRLVSASLVAGASRESELGVFVTTASVAAFDGQVGQAAYAASKGAVAAMTLPLARELAFFGIRVASIAPGLFDTPMLAGIREDARKTLADNIPFPKRFGRPTEFAALALHIIENEMINGEVIRLDGALRMPPR